jgi:shikimate dehydrogenase
MLPPPSIDARTQLVGLIGWPVEHSLSPTMHNTAFEALGLNWRYLPLPVPPDQIEAAARGLTALGFRGANVTVPHKRAVMPVLDAIAPDAQGLGAVNTIVVERDQNSAVTITGHNTDAAGFIGAIKNEGFKPRGKSVVVIGAGGAARAVVFGLLEAGAGEIVVLNRTLARAQSLALDLGSRQADQPTSTIRPARLAPETLIESARAADLLVNATPIGMWPQMDGSIWPDGTPLPAHLTVFDLVYNPLETQLLRQARESGACAIDGLGMLVQQGALAFEMWTGVEAPRDVMRTASRQRLQS